MSANQHVGVLQKMFALSGRATISSDGDFIASHFWPRDQHQPFMGADEEERDELASLIHLAKDREMSGRMDAVLEAFDSSLKRGRVGKGSAESFLYRLAMHHLQGAEL